MFLVVFGSDEHASDKLITRIFPFNIWLVFGSELWIKEVLTSDSRALDSR